MKSIKEIDVKGHLIWLRENQIYGLGGFLPHPHPASNITTPPVFSELLRCTFIIPKKQQNV